MINKVLLIGNVGTEPEIRSLESGVKVARLRVATTERFTTTAGERREHTEWHTVILWRGQADFAERNIRKGSQIYVDGKIRSRERIDEYGGKKTYYEIHADEIKTLGRKDPNHINNNLAVQNPYANNYSQNLSSAEEPNNNNDIDNNSTINSSSIFGNDGMPF